VYSLLGAVRRTTRHTDKRAALCIHSSRRPRVASKLNEKVARHSRDRIISRVSGVSARTSRRQLRGRYEETAPVEFQPYCVAHGLIITHHDVTQHARYTTGNCGLPWRPQQQPTQSQHIQRKSPTHDNDACIAIEQAARLIMDKLEVRWGEAYRTRLNCYWLRFCFMRQTPL